MCIPCVMCGACMGLGDNEGELAAETVCPECGEAVAPTDITCPNCFTFLARNAMLKKRLEDASKGAATDRVHPSAASA